MGKQDGRKLSGEAQEAIRLRVVNFLQTGKGTQQQAADIFQLSLSAVKKTWIRYKEHGLGSLKAKKRGRRPFGRLSKAQQKAITGALKKDTPERYGIAPSLWTANAVRLLIKKKRRHLQ